MSGYTIKDLENLSGIKAHTIRMWEQRYNFLKPQRSCTNIRYYSNEELKTLLNIALLNKHGFKISHIDKMCREEICQKILLLREAEAAQEKLINELMREMVDLQTDKFEAIINKYINTNGIEKCVREVIFPFLERIGILWQTGNIMPAQEHFISNIIRQKLIVAIDGLPAPTEGTACLLFLPEGEHHELGLLFLYYLLKSHGSRVIYLGANVPMGDVQSIIAAMKPERCFIHLTSTAQYANFDKLVKDIQQKIPSVPTIISGHPTQHRHKDIPSSIELKRSLSEVIELIESI